MELTKDSRHSVDLVMPTHRPYENNLHHLVTDFLDRDYDYWLSIDSDNPPYGGNPLDLIDYDKDIMGLPTPVWHWTGEKKGERPIYYNVYRKHGDGSEGYKEWLPQEGLQQVDAVGTGCFLVARRVFEDAEMRKGAFTRKLYPDGTVERGNDISFCERARERGWEVWAHFDYPCDHYSELSLNEILRVLRDYHG